ncbi:MAG: hypothetical protein AABX93_03235 [Nanoarchaeota archaeon]
MKNGSEKNLELAVKEISSGNDFKSYELSARRTHESDDGQTPWEIAFMKHIHRFFEYENISDKHSVLYDRGENVERFFPERFRGICINSGRENKSYKILSEFVSFLSFNLIIYGDAKKELRRLACERARIYGKEMNLNAFYIRQWTGNREYKQIIFEPENKIMRR